MQIKCVQCALILELTPQNNVFCSKLEIEKKKSCDLRLQKVLSCLLHALPVWADAIGWLLHGRARCSNLLPVFVLGTAGMDRQQKR